MVTSGGVSNGSQRHVALSEVKRRGARGNAVSGSSPVRVPNGKGKALMMLTQNMTATICGARSLADINSATFGMKVDVP
jgi:hypothetical protein